MGERTDSSSVHDGDEEGGNKQVQLDHGDVGRVLVGLSVSSEEIDPRFYDLSLFPREDEKRGVGCALRPTQPPPQYFLFAALPK